MPLVWVSTQPWQRATSSSSSKVTVWRPDAFLKMARIRSRSDVPCWRSHRSNSPAEETRVAWETSSGLIASHHDRAEPALPRPRSARGQHVQVAVAVGVVVGPEHEPAAGDGDRRPQVALVDPELGQGQRLADGRAAAAARVEGEHGGVGRELRGRPLADEHHAAGDDRARLEAGHEVHPRPAGRAQRPAPAVGREAATTPMVFGSGVAWVAAYRVLPTSAGVVLMPPSPTS